MIPAIALVLITGIANAQTKKQPVKTNTSHETVKAQKTVTKPSPSATTTSVTHKSIEVKKPTTVIHRKHHHKKGMAAKKMGHK